MADQLEEYRKKMQQRYTGAPQNVEEERKKQEEEKKRREQQLHEDEELAKKLQGSYTGTPVYPPPPQQYRPPNYAPPAQNLPQNPPQYPPNSYPPNAYPPPPQYAPIPNRQNVNNRPSGAYQAANSAGVGCLPQVTDKCCGINAQTCILMTAVVMTIGIIASLIALSN